MWQDLRKLTYPKNTVYLYQNHKEQENNKLIKVGYSESQGHIKCLVLMS